MPIKTITQPRTNKLYKLGRKRPVARCPRFKLSNYLTRALPPPPATMDYSPNAMQALNQIYLNDQLGDCVIAGMAHVVGVLTGNNGGAPFVYNQDQIVALYSAIGGYVPGNPNTDRGCDEQTALNYWQHNGAPSGSNQIAGWISVNGSDPTEYRTALEKIEWRSTGGGMSEYAAYWMIHTGDIGATCSALTAAGATSILLIDFGHPCRSEREKAPELWKALPYHQQWTPLIHGIHDGSSKLHVEYSWILAQPVGAEGGGQRAELITSDVCASRTAAVPNAAAGC